jgi:hypothetical protein
MEEKEFEVSIQFYSWVKAQSRAEAIEKFMEMHNIDDDLELYISAEEIESEE